LVQSRIPTSIGEDLSWRSLYDLRNYNDHPSRFMVNLD
jgi:hypothetical protein